jgi:peptidyl-prolyl cis-trans isomerase A (cyclophilin A)
MRIRTVRTMTIPLTLAALLAGIPALAGKAELLDPAKLNATAPDTYKAKFETTKGEFVIEVQRAWSPQGADRFYNLVKNGFYDDQRLFRVVPGFVVQWGISGDPEISAKWKEASIQDDPVKESNKRGTITFAKTNSPNSRTTQVFVNYKDNTNLDGMKFAPFGRILSGMEVVDKFNAEYADRPTGQQGQMQAEGNAFLDKAFPNLDRIKKATIVE